MDIYDILKELNIDYDEIQHEAIFTVDEAKIINNRIIGIGCKNLFLTDKKGRYFLILMEENKRANMKEIARLLNVSHLSFASTEALKNILKLKQGSVTPLGIMNDRDNLVELVIDSDLKDKKVLVHPNTNTRTISIDFNDLIKFIEYEKHKYVYFA